VPPRESVARTVRVPSVSHRPVWFAEGRVSTAIVQREHLGRGFAVRGPAVVSEYSATTVIPPGWALRVDAVGGLVLERERRRG
jgi:N-methylhydantoinase A